MTNRQDSRQHEEPRHRLPRSSSPLTLSRLTSLSTVLRQHQDLLRNATSLAATTGITSALGFGYWLYAARVFSAQAVGYGSAAISSMILLGTFGMAGLDTMLMGELPRSPNRGRLIMTSCIASFIASFILGLGFALVSLAFGNHFVELNGTVGRMTVFSFGVAVTGATSVLDAATIGLLRGGIQLTRNIAVSVAKMAALPAVAFVLHDVFGVGIMLAWVLGTVASLLPVIVMIKRAGGRILYPPDWTYLWRLRKVVAAHNWLNLAISIPIKLVPVLVAVVVPPASNGAFYIANMIFSLLFMVPQSLSIVLFAVAAGTPEKISEKLRFALRVSLTIGIPAGLAIGLCAHLILSVFGRSYAVLATGPLWLLLASYLPGVFNTMYIAVSRVQGRFNQAAVFLAVFATIRMAALVIGGKLGGLYGLSYGMLAVQLVQCAITAPLVLRTAFAGGIARSTGRSLSTAEPIGETQVRESAGLATLVTLATRVHPQAAGGRGRHRRPAAVAVTAADPATSDTNWRPDVAEQTFSSQQEMGISALIEIATRAADL